MGITFLGTHVDRQGVGRGPDRMYFMLVFFVLNGKCHTSIQTLMLG